MRFVVRAERRIAGSQARTHCLDLGASPLPLLQVRINAMGGNTPTSKRDAKEQLASLRAAMAKANGGKGVHAYIIPSDDPHMSEYAPDCFARRAFISG